MQKKISLVDAAELSDLYTELPKAQAWVLEALMTEAPEHHFTAENRARLLMAEQREAAIVRRIKEILHAERRL